MDFPTSPLYPSNFTVYGMSMSNNVTTTTTPIMEQAMPQESNDTSAEVQADFAAEPSSTPTEIKVETKYLEIHYDRRGYNYIVEAGAAPPKSNQDKWANYVLTYTRHFDQEHDRYTHSHIEIKSAELKKILRTVIRNYPGESFAVEQVKLSMPCKVLLHCRKELHKVCNEGKLGSDAGRQHLKFLLEWYEEEDGELIREYENLIEQNLITYPLLWTIMKPGCTIYAPLRGQPRAFTLEKSSQSRFSYALRVTYTDYDGKKFGNTDTELHIFPFVGSVPINSLSAYPLSWHLREESIREALIKRGRLFEGYQGKNYLEYQGLALGALVNKQKTRFVVNGRVMVDAETFGRMNMDRAVSVTSFRKRRPVINANDQRRREVLSRRMVHDINAGFQEDDENRYDQQEDSGYDSDFQNSTLGTVSPTPEPLTDEQCLNATNLVRGFAFDEKEWMEFFVEKLSPVEWNLVAFDQLVLPVKQKNMVKALVQSHVKDTEEGGFDDIIKGKGRGLISVLHGPPGVGKTLTAESVAEFTRRPLYTVSSGELGTSPTALEQSLSQIMELATVWKAVLLLDEADVFLEKRSLHDINRNALVSIFLRLLEYYQGILILTTNRVESFDEAFQSRIHVALKYSNLTPDSRRAVWKNFFSRFGEEKVALDESAYDSLQSHNLNGRQIKNAVKTAKSLADLTGEKISIETVETVLDIQRDFDRDFSDARKSIPMF